MLPRCLCPSGDRSHFHLLMSFAITTRTFSRPSPPPLEPSRHLAEAMESYPHSPVISSFNFKQYE